MLGWVKYCLEPARVFFPPPSQHGLISVFLLLGRRTKHEKLVFTILDHPVQHKALFRTGPLTVPAVLCMPLSSGPIHLHPSLGIFQIPYLLTSVIKIPLSLEHCVRA